MTFIDHLSLHGLDRRVLLLIVCGDVFNMGTLLSEYGESLPTNDLDYKGFVPFHIGLDSKEI